MGEDVKDQTAAEALRQIDDQEAARPEGSAIVPAFLKAQKAFRMPLRNAENPHFRSRYATLDECLDAVRSALHENGIALLQDLETDGDRVSVRTILIHETGERLESSWLRLKPVKMDPQGEGSALTYARRYSLTTFLGIAAEEDDDANAATAPAQTPTIPPAEKPAAKAAEGDEKKAPSKGGSITKAHHDLGAILMELAGGDTARASRILQEATKYKQSKGASSINDVTPKAAGFLVSQYRKDAAASKLYQASEAIAFDEREGDAS